VSETILPPPTRAVNAVIERTLTITALSEEQFAQLK